MEYGNTQYLQIQEISVSYVPAPLSPGRASGGRPCQKSTYLPSLLQTAAEFLNFLHYTVFLAALQRRGLIIVIAGSR